MKVIPVNHAIHARWSPRTLSGVKEGLVEDGRGERTFRFAIHFQGNIRSRKNLNLQNCFAHKDPKSVEGVHPTI